MDIRISVLLDLDDTILDFDMAERIAVSKTFRDMGIEPTEAVISRYSYYNIMQWEKYELGLITQEDVLTSRFELLFRELGLSCSGYDAQLMYDDLLKIGHYYMPGANEVLEKLYKDYDLYIISNGCADVQDSRLESAGISYMFKDIFISQRVGSQKPRKEFFDACFARIPGFDRNRAIVVGDSLTSDIRGGINAGVTTCWYNPRGKESRPDIVPDYTITDLKELPALLLKLFS